MPLVFTDESQVDSSEGSEASFENMDFFLITILSLYMLAIFCACACMKGFIRRHYNQRFGEGSNDVPEITFLHTVVLVNDIV